MKKEIRAGAVSQTIDVFIQNSSSTTGAGLTGLVFNSAGLTCYYRKGATGAATSLALVTQTVAGAFSSGGFVEVDATNMPGVYRLDLANAIIDTVGSASIMLKGATNMAPLPIELRLVAFDPENATTLGLTNLDAAVSSRMATYVQPTGFLAATFPAGTVANTTNITAGTITTASAVTTVNGLAAGVITASSIAAAAFNGKGDWNIGKTGYSLTQTFPTNFADLAITVTTGRVTVGTNADKTGYSLTAGTGLGNQTADFTGSLSGSVGSVAGLTAATVHADLDDIQARLPAALIGGRIDANLGAISTSATAADNLERSTLGIVTGTVGAASTTTSIVTSALSPAAAVIDQYKGRIVTFDSATTTANLRGQSTDITTNTALGVLTVTALTTAPASGDTFTIT